MSIAWLSAGSAIYDLEIVSFALQGRGRARVGRAFYPTNFDDVAEKLWLNLKNLTLQSQDVCLTRRFI
jgi:hypothetical protein